jgi:plasmid stabilization system protein ParE
VAEISFHPEASEDYREAANWYRERSPEAADRFEAEVERVLEFIALNPEMYPPYDAVHRFATLRRFPYSLVFQASAETAYIVAVAHAHRRPEYWRDRTG